MARRLMLSIFFLAECGSARLPARHRIFIVHFCAGAAKLSDAVPINQAVPISHARCITIRWAKLLGASGLIVDDGSARIGLQITKNV